MRLEPNVERFCLRRFAAALLGALAVVALVLMMRHVPVDAASARQTGAAAPDAIMWGTTLGPALPLPPRVAVKMRRTAHSSGVGQQAAAAPFAALPDTLPDTLLRQLDVTSVQPLLPHANSRRAVASMTSARLSVQWGLERIFLLTLAPEADPAATLDALRALPEVDYAVLDGLATAAQLSTEVPDDPEFERQWGLHNTGQTGGFAGADIAALPAWRVTTGGPETVIAIVDSGIDPDHPDLRANLIPGYDFVNNDRDARDDFGHGTHVAGIAGASGDNGVGVSGVCMACGLLPVKVLNESGYGSTWVVAQGVIYAVDQGADVINLSLETEVDFAPLAEAVAYAHAAGVPVVAAMGNGGDVTPRYPAAYAATIGVGALDHNGERAAFSCYGSHIDLAAPGDVILSTFLGNDYLHASGTSMAAPHVSGTLALMRHLNSALTVEDLRDLVTGRSDFATFAVDAPGLTWNPYTGAGMLAAGPVLQQVAAAMEPPLLPSPAATVVPTATTTLIVTPTATVTFTATALPAPTATEPLTATPTVTSTATATATATATGTPTLVPMPTITPTPSSTPTLVPVATLQPTNPAPIVAPTLSPVVSPTGEPTANPTVAPSTTPTVTPPATAIVTATVTAVPTATPIVTAAPDLPGGFDPPSGRRRQLYLPLILTR